MTARDHAFQVQRNNEERKLAHHRETAQKLRDISERNGNEKLLDVADRLEEKAQSHYDKRLKKIDEQSKKGELADGESLEQEPQPAEAKGEPSAEKPESDRSSLDADAASELSNSLDKRLRNEERKLNHQMQIAEQLRSIAARNGNDNLLQTANRIEQMAADRYVKQLEKLGMLGDAATLAESGLLNTPPSVSLQPAN